MAHQICWNNTKLRDSPMRPWSSACTHLRTVAESMCTVQCSATTTENCQEIRPGHLSHHAVDRDMFSPVASSLRQKLSECGQQRINQWLDVWSLHFLVLSPTLLAYFHPFGVVSQAVHHFSVHICLRIMLHVFVPPIAYWPFYCGRCNHCII